MTDRICLYDSTLRDGAQAQGVEFSAADKHDIALQLDELGIDYIEGGWPGANHTDDAFFADLPKLKRSKMMAFGMTRRNSTSADNDPGLNALANSGAGGVCIVGKAWDFQVTEALGISLEENLAMIADSVDYLKQKKLEVMFDAEHFFDGYKASSEYAMQALKAAYEAGARWVVLCDTNGGTLPHEVEEIVTAVVKEIPGSHLGIHCHNDTENAVANSLAAVRAGVRQVQGTIGGYGERCGNTNLIAIIPTLKLKLGFDVGIDDKSMKKLKKISNSLDDRLNRPRYKHAAYVGSSAFAHKGGLHVSAVVKYPRAYEHIEPETVGNERVILVSDQAGRSNIVNRIKQIGIELNLKDESVREKISALVDEVKKRENQGYAYESADASFELLARRIIDNVPNFYTLLRFKILDERSWDENGEAVTSSIADVTIDIDGKEITESESGNGPVNALNRALKKALGNKYSQIADIRLTDYKVRIVTPERGTEAVTRVQIETSDDSGKRWNTVGVSTNIIDASANALHDAITYRLIRG